MRRVRLILLGWLAAHMSFGVLTALAFVPSLFTQEGLLGASLPLAVAGVCGWVARWAIRKMED